MRYEVIYMIRIAIVDDEKIILNQVSRLIKESIDEEIFLDVYESSRDFARKIEKSIYDIIFLDIDMPEINGFELAETLTFVKPNITIVFISHLEHLVFRSFRFKPFGFVRKSYLEKDIDYIIDIYMHITDNKYKLKRERGKELSMKTLSEQFEKKGFIRIHKSFLVNFRYIYKINKNNVELKEGKPIDINPHKVKEIRDRFQHFSMMEE